MLDTANISSLTDFKRNSLEYIQRLKQTGAPEVLTVNGRAAVVVQDAAAYQELLRKADYAETVEAVRAGMAAHPSGESVPISAALEAIASKVGFAPKK